MKKISLLFAGVMLFMSSCSTITKTANISNAVNGNVLVNPITANLDFNSMETVTGTATTSYIFNIDWSTQRHYIQTAGSPLYKSRMDKVKDAALYDAMAKTDFDVLVHPVYETEVDIHLFGLVKIYTVTVKGQGAKVKSYRQVKPGEQDYDTLLNGKSSVSRIQILNQ